MNQSAIDTLSKLATDAAQSAIANYTRWQIAATIIWILLAALLLCFALVLLTKAIKIPKDERDEPPFVFLLIAIIVSAFIGFMIIGSTLPDLISPRAAAIHQLLKDATGK